MSLNLKNPDTTRLIHELADVTGESMTQAVTEAVRERLQRLRTDDPEELASRLVAIGRECAAHLSNETLSMDHDELLYDELGLPK